MAHNKEKIYKQAMEAIKEKNLITIEDVVSHLPISKPTFYKYFKPESNEFNALKKEVEFNQLNLKLELRKRWSISDNFPAQVALYKLICTDEERKKLSMSYHEVNAEITEKPKLTKGFFD
jgi:hypothetical protein